MLSTELRIRLEPHSRTPGWDLFIAPLLPKALENSDAGSVPQVIKAINDRYLNCFIMLDQVLGIYCGCFITNIIQNTNGVNYLNIFVCCIANNAPRWVMLEAEEDLRTRIIPSMEDVGGPKIHAITFRTTRPKGFSRRLGKVGYRERLTEFILKMEK